MDKIRVLLEGKRIALLGFGREGRSSYTLIRRILPRQKLTLVDDNENVRNDPQLTNDPDLQFITGENCLIAIDDFDIAIKSPGIPSNRLPIGLQKVKISSQTDLFLQCYGKQVIGITGTKGKSTTASLVFHILKNTGRNALLVGNIGIPPFDCIDDIVPDSVVVMELSSHQLEFVTHSPHIAVLLNLFQEHLDHYHSYDDYKLAKLNIAKFQGKGDFFIYNRDNEALNTLVAGSGRLNQELLPFSLETGTASSIRKVNNWIELNTGGTKNKIYDTRLGQHLIGHHNIYNIMAASAACYLVNVSADDISSGIRSFKGLEHRIEPVGEYEGISWYNDSIATIPEATIEAVKTLKNVDTLILGGFDRGIEYKILYPFLVGSGISNIIFIGAAGTRIMNEFSEYGASAIRFYTAADFSELIEIAKKVTKKGSVCLLSPAAASYDMFRNFEERGNVYKKNVRNLGPSQNFKAI